MRKIVDRMRIREKSRGLQKGRSSLARILSILKLPRMPVYGWDFYTGPVLRVRCDDLERFKEEHSTALSTVRRDGKREQKRKRINHHLYEM